MSQKYLLLGGSSDLSLAFLRQHNWQSDDEIIAQYCHNCEALEEFKAQQRVQMGLWQADFSCEDSTARFVAALKERNFVPTHILHVPAVPIVNQRFTEIEWQDTERQLHVQCRSLILVLQSVIKKMVKAKKGKIIVGLSSYSINIPPKFLSSYVMAKYALLGLSKSLAAEYASKGIQVNMISPSMMETKFLANVYDGVIEQSAQSNPMGRNVTPVDVAGTIEYLFSDACSFVTGMNIPVTGGEAF